MIEEEQIQQLAKDFEACQDLLVAIGDEVRQHIILMMMAGTHTCGEDCKGIRVGELANRTNLSRPAVSHHVQILKRAGILNVNREGTRNYYYFDRNTKVIEQLMALLLHAKEIVEALPERSNEDD